MPEQSDRPPAAVVILAAGEGKRMKSSRSKLLHEIAGHSMLSYAVTAATNVRPEHIVVVVGHRRDQVEAHLAEVAPHVLTAVQSEQLGTGHAVQIALGQLADLSGEVIVTLGDVPMLTADTLAALLLEHRRQQAAVTVLTARVPDPTGYGRILRDADGLVTGIVEHRDADDVQRAIDEINSGIFVFEADVLRAALAQLAPTNDQGELYLTDVLTIARRGRPDRRRLPDRRPLADRRGQRSGPAVPDERRGQPANPRTLDARRGDGRRPGEHLGARLGRSRA